MSKINQMLLLLSSITAVLAVGGSTYFWKYFHKLSKNDKGGAMKKNYILFISLLLITSCAPSGNVGRDMQKGTIVGGLIGATVGAVTGLPVIEVQ